MKLYQALADALIEQDDAPVFGLMGDANMLYASAFRERGGRFVAAAHETGAVAMADSWSRATGRIGLSTVTHGPGVTNALTGLVEAVRSRSHVLLLTGATPAEPTHFQRLDLSTFAAAAGAGYERVHRPESLYRDVSRALQRILAEERPVLLDVPYDFLLASVSVDPAALRAPSHRARFVAGEMQLDSALGLIASAKRPVILAGRGAVTAGAERSLAELAELIGAPLATSVPAKDLFAGHPSNLGICGNLAHAAASTVLAEADCIVAFGSSLNLHTTMHGELTSGKKIVQIDSDPGRFGWYVRPDEAVVGDADDVASGLIALLHEAGHKPQRGWLDRAQGLIADFDPRSEFLDRSNGSTIDVRVAAAEVDERLPATRNVVSDIGRFVNAAWPYIHTDDASRFTAMGGFGAIGLGLAGAIGMAVARPDAPTVCLVGDGGFMMNPAELATAVREQLPLIVVVFDDGAYGAEYHKFVVHGVDPAHSYMSWPDIGRVAEGLGAEAMSVTKTSDFDAVAELLVNRTRPLVLDIRLDPTVDIVA
ncbi:thiamine pyrophosphate-binding protein [Pseudonocardia alaniniphila]|uniref:Thiamine pyrophosphate-binding protein n=1 Tax=Pseudonocardia alaniniphila TaxID=75291 RepID=A0ABS9TTA2_9PSEU|nr:thiamine pyrophosphate-binding protein [Pseudonocardia alaniniphila]MCH6171798.1 thiamine pyrophosphate-binding protein [Pseudonocardia alaniniphila]